MVGVKSSRIQIVKCSKASHARKADCAIPDASWKSNKDSEGDQALQRSSEWKGNIARLGYGQLRSNGILQFFNKRSNGYSIDEEIRKVQDPNKYV